MVTIPNNPIDAMVLWQALREKLWFCARFSFQNKVGIKNCPMNQIFKDLPVLSIQGTARTPKHREIARTVL